LIYKALIYKSLKEPYQLIFHELKETEARYRLLFENMKSGFALHKLIVNDDNKPVDYEFIDVNKAFEKHSGLVKESVIGKRVLEVLPDIKSDSFDWIGKYGEITQNNKFADFESYSKILKRWFNVKAYSPMKGYFATIIEDITDKKNLQIKLTNQTNTLQAIFDNAPFILALVDENLKIERINRVGIEYSGKKESDILGNLSGSVFNCINTFDGVSCGNGANCQTCPIRTSVYYTAKHGKPVNNREGQMELLIAGKHTPVDLLISTSLIKIDDKDKILLSLIDITERKRIEVMLHEALDLSRQKEAEVENLLQEKELLLREVHHRIKNNMSTVESLLRLHMKQIDNKEAQAALIDANSRIRSVQVLYEKLFRSDNFNEVDMRDYLSPMLDEVISVFPVHSEVAIIKKIDSFPIDAKLVFPFGIIINEIVTNIMKYAFVEDKQDKKIEVTAEKIENQARVIIHDNGMGMPPDFNLEEAKGFGLHLVKMLINQIKGEMKIENVEGTKFTLIFPLNAGKK
jgi:PAS domain S-box-containing protein